MTKLINKMMHMFLVVLFLCGCSRCTSFEQTSQKQGQNIETGADGGFSLKNDYDIYEIDSEKSRFKTSIIENPIDTAYEKEISSVSTIGEMIQIETKYILFWQKEMESSIAKYVGVLSDEDKNAFEKSQATFDEFSKTSFDFDSEILLQGKYNVHVGTSSKWLLYVERKKVIRERTIHIKYLHFILERSLSNEESYTSLAFDSWDAGTA